MLLANPLNVDLKSGELNVVVKEADKELKY